MIKHELSWRAINRRLRSMTEDELQAMIDAEVVGQRRVFVAERLHQRLAAMRTFRERQELMGKLNENTAANAAPAVARGDDGQGT